MPDNKPEAWYTFVQVMGGQVLGALCFLLGAVLSFFPVSNTTGVLAQAGGFSLNLNQATPGIILMIIGPVVIFLTRRNHQNTTAQNDEPPKDRHAEKAPPTPVASDPVSPAPPDAIQDIGNQVAVAYTVVSKAVEEVTPVVKDVFAYVGGWLSPDEPTAPKGHEPHKLPTPLLGNDKGDAAQ